MLYDLVQCPHRPMMDLFGDPVKRDEVSPFVQLLWEMGTTYEKEVISNFAVPFLDLSGYAGDEKECLTLEAMGRGEALIYGGRISTDDLLGNPDLLRREGDGYVAGDIKSGAGEEGGDEDQAKLKKHYAVQLALYTDILERKGLSGGRTPFVWDIHGEEVAYPLDEPQGQKNQTAMWEVYQNTLTMARSIVVRSEATLPAYGGICKLCHWYTACTQVMREADDLTLIFELGRATRDNMLAHVGTIHDFAAANPETFIVGKKTIFPGLGPDRLRKFHARARLLSENGSAYLRAPVALPHAERELFFDIEDDPIRKVCYLHGFIERTGGNNGTERYVPFFADEPIPLAEGRAFADAIAYIQVSQPCVIYYYAGHERTVYRKLRAKYPHVIGDEELERLFEPSRSVDLYYHVVLKATEWPTSDFSLKTLAKHLGFSWRDTHPSGAASIEWFNRWIETGESTVKQRILDYNEDDCRATRVLLDGIRVLQ